MPLVLETVDTDGVDLNTAGFGHKQTTVCNWTNSEGRDVLAQFRCKIGVTGGALAAGLTNFQARFDWLNGATDEGGYAKVSEAKSVAADTIFWMKFGPYLVKSAEQIRIQVYSDDANDTDIDIDTEVIDVQADVQLMGAAVGLVGAGSTTTQFTLSTAFVGTADAYVGEYIAVTDAGDGNSEVRLITNYTAGRVITVSRPFSFTPAANDVAVMQPAAYGGLVGNLNTLVSSWGSETTTVFRLDAGETANDAYNGMLVSVTDVTDLLTEIRRIVNYDGSNKEITVDRAFSFTPTNDDRVQIHSVGYADVNVTHVLAATPTSAAGIVTALMADTGLTEGGTWTVEKILKIMGAWAGGKWQDKSESPGTYEVLDAEDATTGIMEVTPSATTPQKTVSVQI